jgi:formylglycine-generating enzyme required for sulfatase activity
VRDIAGNVSEWVADWYQPYSGSDYESADFGKNNKVVRGASWSDGSVHYNLRLFQRGAYRFYLPPDGRYEDVGFRCVTEIKSTDASS